MGWQLLPLLRELFKVSFDIRLQAGTAQLIGFREYDGEGYLIVAQPFDELKVDGQRGMAAVDEQEKVGHLHTAENVALNDVSQFIALLLASAGVAVAWEVNNVPGVVDEEMVDEQRLAWGGGSHCQPVPTGEHVDEARLTDIRAAYEGIFRQSVLRTAGNVGVAYDEGGAFYLHEQGNIIDFRHKGRVFLWIIRIFARKIEGKTPESEVRAVFIGTFGACSRRTGEASGYRKTYGTTAGAPSAAPACERSRCVRLGSDGTSARGALLSCVP